MLQILINKALLLKEIRSYVLNFNQAAVEIIFHTFDDLSVMLDYVQSWIKAAVNMPFHCHISIFCFFKLFTFGTQGL